MIGTTDMHLQEIYRRTRKYRHRLERRALFGLTAAILLLLTAITRLLRRVQTPGISTVANAYSAVLLRNDVSAYIVVGITAFVAGAMCTVVCMRYRK